MKVYVCEQRLLLKSIYRSITVHAHSTSTAPFPHQPSPLHFRSVTVSYYNQSATSSPLYQQPYSMPYTRVYSSISSASSSTLPRPTFGDYLSIPSTVKDNANTLRPFANPTAYPAVTVITSPSKAPPSHSSEAETQRDAKFHDGGISAP